MATLQHAGSRRMYSWWWDSHISPKNSKWLQENLTDMDAKVKAMIKVIEEDADSFARRAEMYYRKRPELLKLVEEFYRAYRALAERYDHATGALRQAQRTMAEAFPDQVPFILSDESPSGPYATEAEPHTPEMFLPTHTFVDLDDSQKDSFGTAPHSHAIKRNGASFEEKFAEGRVRKGLNFQEEEGKGSVYNVHEEEVSQLSSENQNLKNQILSESKHAGKAEAEIQTLKDIVSKLSSEKEDALLKYQLSHERMSNLENEFSSTQGDFRKLRDEMLIEATMLKSVKEQCLVLEKENKSLQLELETCRQSAKKLQEELTLKQEVLEKLDISIQDERKRCMQSETALQLLEKLHSQSQEEARILALEVQGGVEKLKNMALSKVGLEEEMQRLTEENSRLNYQLLSSALKIKNLEDELNILKESKQILDNELGRHVDERKVLQEEICSLKADKSDLEQKLRELAEQINSVNVSVVSLQALVKELQDGNVELKERCEKHCNEKVLLLENLKHMENISEKNAVLENSLSDANAELEGLRQKIKTLEESCEFLHGSISVHISEKASLVSQVASIAQKVEKLSEKNTLLENSLSDVNVELEGLRGKLAVFEESCQSLKDQRSSLLTEKSTLISEVDSISHSLEKLESRYEELEGKNFSLAGEKDKALDQVRELQDFLKVEKQKHENLIEASKRQLTALEKQILLLQNESQQREEELEMEQHKIMNVQFEIFILQRCLGESVENFFILLDECQKNVEASRCAEKLVLKLEQEDSVRQKNLALLSECNQKLVEGLHLMMKMLHIHEICGFSDGTQDDISFLQFILHKIRDLQTSFSDAQDDNQCLLLERSVILTLLEQLELDMANLKSANNVVERESKTRAEKLSALQNEKHELVEVNEQLMREVKDCNQREEVLKAEMKILSGQISDSQEVHCTLESEVCRLLEENQSLSKKCYDLMKRKDILEEENSAILAEAMNLECLYLIFSRSNAERTSDLQLSHHNLDNLHETRRDLEKMIRVINEKLGVLEVENMHLKEVIVDLEESNRHLVFLEDELSTIRNVSEQLNLEIETWKVLLVEKDRELADANQKIEATQENNDRLCRNLEDLMLDISGAKVMREELEEKIIALSEENRHRDNEITCLRKANEMLKGEHDKMNHEIEELRNKEKHLISELEEKTNLVNSSEADTVILLNDIQIATINAAVFEEKMHDLLLARESPEIKAMVQREMLHEEFKLRNIYEDELKEKLDALEGENRSLKEELNAYLPLVMSLSDGVASLEEHTLSLTNHDIFKSEEKQASPSVSLQHNGSNQEEIEVLTASAGILELQRLHTKVNVLEKMLMNADGLLEQERSVSNANSEAPVREITGLESKHTTSQEEAEIGKDIILELESEKPSTDHTLQGGDAEIATVKPEQMMKDIQLDHVLSSSQHENGVSSSAETEDRMPELWETVSGDCNKMQKAALVASEHDIEYHQIEAVEEEKNECPSGRVAEKELSIDKLELPKKVTETHRKQNKSVVERLSSDTLRLSALQTIVQELKRDIETFEMSNHPTSLEFDTVKAQLKEAEGAISQLIDINIKLTKKSADFSASADSLIGEQNENGNGSEKKISEQAQRGSEKIARLELELQKIQYILLKLKEEYENRRTKAMERRRSVLLRDYLYGRRESPRRKKVRCCACVKPKTKDD